MRKTIRKTAKKKTAKKQASKKRKAIKKRRYVTTTRKWRERSLWEQVVVMASMRGTAKQAVNHADEIVKHWKIRYGAAEG